MDHLDITDIVQRLELAPHPEGGFYRETWVESDEPGVRSHGTAIYFLLPGNVENRWHRIDAAEIWQTLPHNATGSCNWDPISTPDINHRASCRPTVGSAQ